MVKTSGWAILVALAAVVTAVTGVAVPLHDSHVGPRQEDIRDQWFKYDEKDAKGMKLSAMICKEENWQGLCREIPDGCQNLYSKYPTRIKSAIVRKGHRCSFWQGQWCNEEEYKTMDATKGDVGYPSLGVVGEKAFGISCARLQTTEANDVNLSIRQEDSVGPHRVPTNGRLETVDAFASKICKEDGFRGTCYDLPTSCYDLTDIHPNSLLVHKGYTCKLWTDYACNGTLLVTFFAQKKEDMRIRHLGPALTDALSLECFHRGRKRELNPLGTSHVKVQQEDSPNSPPTRRTFPAARFCAGTYLWPYCGEVLASECYDVHDSQMRSIAIKGRHLCHLYSEPICQWQKTIRTFVAAGKDEYRVDDLTKLPKINAIWCAWMDDSTNPLNPPSSGVSAHLSINPRHHTLVTRDENVIELCDKPHFESKNCYLAQNISNQCFGLSGGDILSMKVYAPYKCAFYPESHCKGKKPVFVLDARWGDILWPEMAEYFNTFHSWFCVKQPTQGVLDGHRLEERDRAETA